MRALMPCLFLQMGPTFDATPSGGGYPWRNRGWSASFNAANGPHVIVVTANEHREQSGTKYAPAGRMVWLDGRGSCGLAQQIYPSREAFREEGGCPRRNRGHEAQLPPRLTPLFSAGHAASCSGPSAQRGNAPRSIVFLTGNGCACRGIRLYVHYMAWRVISAALWSMKTPLEADLPTGRSAASRDIVSTMRRDFSRGVPTVISNLLPYRCLRIGFILQMHPARDVAPAGDGCQSWNRGLLASTRDVTSSSYDASVGQAKARPIHRSASYSVRRGDLDSVAPIVSRVLLGYCLLQLGSILQMHPAHDVALSGDGCQLWNRGGYTRFRNVTDSSYNASIGQVKTRHSGGC